MRDKGNSDVRYANEKEREQLRKMHEKLRKDRNRRTNAEAVNEI